MVRQKCTVDPKCSAVKEVFLTVSQPEPLENNTRNKEGFQVVKTGKLSDRQRKARSTKAGTQANVGIIDIECVSVKGNILPAEFAMTYSFQLANFSDKDLAQVPVTIYFNSQGSPLVEQGKTVITDVKAGHYQLVQFQFPPVQAGRWTMTLKANQPKAFEESTYENNALSRNFTYTAQAELVAVSVEDTNPMVNSDGDNYFPLDTEQTLEFRINNIGSADANNLLVQVPAAFQDQTGTYSTMLAETRMNLPAHTGGRAQLSLSFTKNAVAQIGLLVNGDKSCPEISHDNNETHEIFVIGNPGLKPNPDTGGVKEYIEELTLTIQQLREVYWAQFEVYKYLKKETDKTSFIEGLSVCNSVLSFIFTLPTPVQVASALTGVVLQLFPDEFDALFRHVIEGKDFLDQTKIDLEKLPQYDQVKLVLPFLEYEDGFRLPSGEGEVLAYHHENGGWVSPGNKPL